jgi:pimeloyl-ACP methyl ester carboxylesterase
MDAEPAEITAWREQGMVRDIDGRALFVVDAGPRDAPAALVLHGFPGSTYDWHAVIPAVAEQARVVAFDFLGYGLSAKPFDAGYSLFEQADLAEGVARAAGLDRCTVVAHDMGDTVAAELLHRRQEGRLGFEVDRAILTNGSIFIHLAQLAPAQLALLSMPDEPLADPLPLEAFRPGLEATFGPEHPPEVADLDAMVWLVARDGGDRLLPRLIRYIEERRRNQDRWTEGLVGFDRPMTAIWGTQDPIAVPAMTERLAALRPATEIVEWRDVGHWPSLEVPDRLAGAILHRLPGS